MRSVFSCLAAFVLLTGCSYSVESTNQDIMFVTPEAQDARCYVTVDKRKYQVYPPQKINVKKSPKDMIVACNAPGNRHVDMEVPATFSKRALWGGPPGVAWDYASQSLYYYPDVIAIDFSGQELVPNKPPQHNNSDIMQPEEYDLEEFLPAEPLLNSDKGRVEGPIKLRVSPDAVMVHEHIPSEPAKAQGKGDLQSVLDSAISGSGGKPLQVAPVQ